MKSFAHYMNTLSGISLKIGLREYYALKKKFGIYAAYELSADIQKIDREQEENFYHKVVGFLFLKSTKELQNKICRVILAVRQNTCDETEKSEYADLQKTFEEMKLSAFTPQRWKSISAFFISNGLFYLGEICREKSRDALLNRKYHLGDHWRRCIWYLEMDDLENAGKEIDLSASGWFMKKYRNSDIGCAKIYYNILKGNCSNPAEKENQGQSRDRAKQNRNTGSYKSSAAENNEKKSEKTDFLYDVSEYAPTDAREKAFHTYVKNRDFLVIGPAPRESEIGWNAGEMKVVRSNDRGEDHGMDPVSSLSYYNGPGTRWIRENGGEDFSSRFDFVVVKHACKDLDVKNMHRVGDFNCILPAGHLNMLPVMVIDLQYNEAGNIYVCGNNLFFSKNPWKKGYQSAQSDWNRTNFWPGLCNHEIYSQFHLLQNTYKHHAFVADEELRRVLSMTVREYAKGMEKIYSIP